MNISCAICQPTLRKNVIKERKFFNRHDVFQPLLTNKTMELGLIKGEKKHKKKADQNGMYLNLLTLVNL